MIAWFARNGVAANLCMLIVVVGGTLALPMLKVQLFPDFTLETVQISVPYPGASPEEVEEGIVMRIEEALQGLEGVKEINSSALENAGLVLVEVGKGFKLSTVKENIKTRVDAITTFPEDAERPVIEELLFPRDVLFLAIAGDMEEKDLRQLTERVRDDMTAIDGISQVTMLGVREYEIGIEVTEQRLRQYNLTFDEVSMAVQRSSLDLPGGSIKAEGGEILLRTLGQAYVAEDFAGIVLRVHPNGTRVLLSDVATINDGFVDRAIISEFDGKPASFLQIQEVGDENPIEISNLVQAYIESAEGRFPPGVTLAKFADASFYLKGRLSLLIKNGAVGLLLVLLVLTAFLRPLLAFFVALGIPVSFLGTLLLAPYVDLSINLISLFAFILVLGIVVDDAIVVGESVFHEFQTGSPGVESAIRGTHAVSMPVTFAVVTTMAAFLPLFFLPGTFGKFFTPIPIVVIATLTWSLVQSKLVLPYHLSLLRTGTGDRARLGRLSRLQRAIADGLERFVSTVYQPFLHVTLRWRYVTLAAFVGGLIVAITLMTSGWVRQVPFPEVPNDYIIGTIEYPAGSPLERTIKGVDQVQRALDRVAHEVIEVEGKTPILHSAVFSGVDTHEAVMVIELTKSETREIEATEFVKRWRAGIGSIPGVKSVTFVAEAAVSAEDPINIQLVGLDFDQLQRAAQDIKLGLAEFPAVYDIGDNFSSGKREIKLKVKPQAEVLGITSSELGRQVRQAFYGDEAQRVQRGRNDVRVMVRYPREERESVGNLENMRIRLPHGGEVPFSEVADISIGQGFNTIQRVDRERVLNISAKYDKEIVDATSLNKEIEAMTEAILSKYPGVVSSLEGEAAENEEMLNSLYFYGGLAMVLIYVLLAVPLRSYLQPLIVMAAIPFAFVGAVLGHFVTFQSMSMLSYMGMLAAFGVVVNDSLVLVDYVNKKREDGAVAEEAVLQAGGRRFRPILLTSLTTFVGLLPILLEKSLQAQFLIPMATSLSFGVLFATFITLFLVPCLYLIGGDLHRGFASIGRGIKWVYGSTEVDQLEERRRKALV